MASSPPTPSVRDAALAALDAGLSVVPPREDGTKAPQGLWNRYQGKLPSEDQVRAWYANGRTGLGVVCGAVSGGLEFLEFEGRAVAVGLDQRFWDLCEAAGLKDLLDRVRNGYSERTPSGGIHLAYRVPTPLGNTKLARRPATVDELADNPDQRVQVLVETRGQGGYMITAPSHGRVHETGRPYVRTSGSFHDIAKITDDDRDELWRVARMLDSMPESARPAPTPTPDVEGSRPGDAYNAAPDRQERVRDLLEANGWTHVYSRDGSDYLRRPGKDRGVSASLGHVAPGVLRVFTTSTELEDKAHSPFSVYAKLLHSGDYSVAARDLAAQGYGREDNAIIDRFDQDVVAEVHRRRVRKAARDALNDDRGASELPPPWRLDEFLRQPDPSVLYRIDRLWPADGRVLLAAQYKAGKTTLLANVMRALVDGKPFLGRYEVAVPDGGVYLIDDELNENVLRRWLREQCIVAADRVHGDALRGRVTSFDILEDRGRTQWARRIGDTGATVVLLDCLRPVIDANGLSEDRDAGIVLGAFDALLTEAGVSEAAIVHHMGHSGERSRGDSRLRDWPDAEWKLVRQEAKGSDDPRARRFLSAYGRDVDEPEQQLHLDGRRLSITGGSREEHADRRRIEAVVHAVTANPGCGATELRTTVTKVVGGQAVAVDKARNRALEEGLIRLERQGQKHNYYPVSTVSNRVQDMVDTSGGDRVRVSMGDTDTGTAQDSEIPQPDLARTGHG